MYIYIYSKNLEFMAGEGSCLRKHLMFKYYMTDTFMLSTKALKIKFMVSNMWVFTV